MTRQRQDIVPEQHQKLFLTTELKQGLSILSMSSLELREYLFDCVMSNPFLEEAEPIRQQDGSTETAAGSDTFVSHVNTDALFERMMPRQRTASDGKYGEIKEEFFFEKYLTQTQSVEEYLEQQFGFELDSDELRAIGRFLIGNLDTNGYLRISVEEAAILLKVSPKLIDRALNALQSCEPAGIAARNLQECLLLQAQRQGKDTFLFRAIVEDHLDDIAKHRFAAIATELEVSAEDVQEISDYLRSLDPRPGLRLPCAPSPTIRPEVLVVRSEDRFSVKLQEFDIPALSISHEYAALLEKRNLDKSTRQYMEQNLKTAHGIIDGVEQRRITILKIASCIVDHQQSFFANGIAGLKPLTMAQVAKESEIHESTVSRVVNGCYLQSDNGLFELRYFFHSSVGKTSSDAVSSKSIQHQIAALISDEDPLKPLSDARIQKKLADHNIEISRRTINKYRKELGIASASKRKRL